MHRSRRRCGLAVLTALSATAALLLLPATSGAISWTQQTIPAGTGFLEGISCVNATDCWSLGGSHDILATTNAGNTWTPQTAPSVAGAYPSGISCVNATDCWIASGGILATVDGGTEWLPQTTPNGTHASGHILCINAMDCWASGIATTNGGSTWTEQAGSVGEAIACVSSSDCWAVGGNTIVATTDGGTEWTKQSTPSTQDSLTGVSCLDADHCVAVGTANNAPIILVTANGGGTWTEQPPPSGFNVLNAVSCVAGTINCWAVGSTTSDTGDNITGYVIATTDSGEAWSTEATFPETATGGGGASSISCPITGTNMSTCWAAGENRDDATTTGVIWAMSGGAPTTIANNEGTPTDNGGGSNTPSTTTTTGTTTTPATAAATGSVSLAGSTITVTSSGKAQVKLTCTGTATCGGKLTLTAKTKSKGKKKATTKTIGTSSFSIPAGKTATVTLALTGTGRALLSAAHGKLTTTLTILKSSPGPSNTQTHSDHLAQQKANKAKKGKKK